ncbi:MAG: DUF433 domain-containing protein [Blastocatellales bacterium]
MIDVITEHITKTPDVCGGKARIEGHRIRVMDIALLHERLGLSVNEIIGHYPNLTLGDVHAALAYYFDHIEEIRDEIRSEHEYVEEFQRKNASALQTKLDWLTGVSTK